MGELSGSSANLDLVLCVLYFWLQEVFYHIFLEPWSWNSHTWLAHSKANFSTILKSENQCDLQSVVIVLTAANHSSIQQVSSHRDCMVCVWLVQYETNHQCANKHFIAATLSIFYKCCHHVELKPKTAQWAPSQIWLEMDSIYLMSPTNHSKNFTLEPHSHIYTPIRRWVHVTVGGWNQTYNLPTARQLLSNWAFCIVVIWSSKIPMMKIKNDWSQNWFEFQIWTQDNVCMYESK